MTYCDGHSDGYPPLEEDQETHDLEIVSEREGESGRSVRRKCRNCPFWRVDWVNRATLADFQGEST